MFNRIERTSPRCHLAPTEIIHLRMHSGRCGAIREMLEATRGLPDLPKARRDALEARWRGEMATPAKYSDVAARLLPRNSTRGKVAPSPQPQIACHAAPNSYLAAIPPQELQREPWQDEFKYLCT
jgi:hypothetical protein